MAGRWRWRSPTRARARVNVPLIASALAAILCAALYAGHLAHVLTLPGLDAWEASTEDARARLRGPITPADRDIVVVALDDRTRRLRPELFQSRAGLAQIIDAVGKARPRVVGLDMFFSDPEKRLDPEVVAEVAMAAAGLEAVPALRRTPAEVAALAALHAVIEQTHGDREVAGAIRRAGTVELGALFYLAGETEPVSRDPEPAGLAGARLAQAVVTRQPPGRRPPRAFAVTSSLPSIARAAAGAGFVNITPDPDGAVRRLPLVIEFGGRYYQSLSLSMVLAARSRPGHRVGAGYLAGDETLTIGEDTVPVDRRARASIDYLGPGDTFPHFSAVDVVDGQVAPAALRDRIVLIGYTDAARDTMVQPFDRVAPGVEIHATLIYDLLHGMLLRRAPPSTSILLCLLLGTLLTALALRRVRQRRAWVVGVGAVCLAAAYLVVCQIAYAHSLLVLPVVAPVLGLVITAAATLSTALGTEGREKAQLRSAFSRYVHAGVVERILADPARVGLGGERRELTVLFSDIRGFSGTAEKLEPEALSDYMNRYLTPMTEIVLGQGGMLDKYIGDAIMAVYGAPLEAADHAARACRTALAMLHALAPLGAELERRGLPPVEIGVGINSGPMAVGNMGSKDRFDYTVLGDAVNLGARLETLTRHYRVDVLVGEGTQAAAAGEFVFRELDFVRVKGRAGVGRIFELCGPTGGAVGGGPDRRRFADGDLDHFAAALADYRAGRWDACAAALGEFLERHPGDGPARVLLDRLPALRARPDGRAWDGVFDQLVK